MFGIFAPPEIQDRDTISTLCWHHKADENVSEQNNVV